MQARRTKDVTSKAAPALVAETRATASDTVLHGEIIYFRTK
jgi:hypothetical protein